MKKSIGIGANLNIRSITGNIFITTRISGAIASCEDSTSGCRPNSSGLVMDPDPPTGQVFWGTGISIPAPPNDKLTVKSLNSLSSIVFDSNNIPASIVIGGGDANLIQTG